MADILGFLAGCGMAALVGALIVFFLRQMGCLRRETALLLGRSAFMACGAGLMYLAFALLIHLLLYQSLSVLELGALFRGPYMTQMLSALGRPADAGLLSMAFAGLSFLLGSACFGQYAFCGLCLAWCMTGASLFLIQLRFRKLADDRTARDMAFLLLCLPGGVFFLLPGFAPLCLLLFAIAFYFLGKRLRVWKPRLSPAGYGCVVSLCACLSAFVTVCATEGRLG